MIMNNENKKLSRNREKRIDRKIKMDDKIKLLFKKIYSGNKRKIKNIDKMKHLEIELVKIKYANDPDNYKLN